MRRCSTKSFRSAFKPIHLSRPHPRHSSSKPSQQPARQASTEGKQSEHSKEQESDVKQKEKTQAELDKELEMKMMGLSGDGGEAGVELEDGQPVSMKRSVRNNMLRYI